MNVKPILMQPDMVRATLREIENPGAGKSQTRRVVKPQPAGAWAAPGKTACPYGQPGDLLYVRETHAIVPRTAYAQSAGVQQTLRPGDDHDAAIFREGWDRSPPSQWRPSIHMPRWASRITLELIDVRVERVQDISNADAVAEGIGTPTDIRYAALDGFKPLWDRINAARGYGWAANPWVWVLVYRPHLINVDAFLEKAA